jgi:hypothetical protein
MYSKNFAARLQALVVEGRDVAPLNPLQNFGNDRPSTRPLQQLGRLQFPHLQAMA